MDDLIAIATFTFPNEMDVLETLLQDAGISYFLQNEGVSLVMPPVAVGGISLIVKAPDVQNAVELLKRDGFAKYLSGDFL